MTDPYGALLAVDKPEGISSFDVIRQLRRQLGRVKAGHAGTLDQPASGLLLVCIGKATRFIRIFQDMPKVYTAEVQLGMETDTDDLSGSVVRTAVVPPGIDGQTLAAVLPAFTGVIRQTPPAYSALKIGGRRAADLARSGQEVPLKEREVTIHDLQATFIPPDRLSLQVQCSKGTYIRSLGRDISRAMGVPGTIRTLRRVAIGRYRVEEALAVDSFTADTLKEAAVPLERALDNLPSFSPAPEVASRIRHGILPPDLPQAPAIPWLRVLDGAGRLLAVLQYESRWRFCTVFTEAF